MKIRLLIILFLLIACTSQCDSMPEFTPTSHPITESSPTLSQEDISKMTPIPSIPNSPNLQNLIEKAREDLAKRLSISLDLVTIVDARDVTWPNSSMGCPQPGMVYADVLTPGYLIILHATDQDFEYHAGKNAEIFYCETPTSPVPGMSGDT